MDLPNVKELEKLLKMCRKQGVNKLTLAELVVEFGELPTSNEEKLVDAEGVLPVVPSDEDMAYWSSQPDPLAEAQQ